MDASQAEGILVRPVPEAYRPSAAPGTRSTTAWTVRVLAAILVAGLLAALGYHTSVGNAGTPIGGGQPWSTALLALAFILSGMVVARNRSSFSRTRSSG